MTLAFVDAESDPVPPRTRRLLTAREQSQPAYGPAPARAGESSLYPILPRVPSAERAPLTLETGLTCMDVEHHLSLITTVPVPAAATLEARFESLLGGKTRYVSELAKTESSVPPAQAATAR